jgi:hypothetical protein
MKSLNDSLRDEFTEILNESEFQSIIENKKLDYSLIKNSFDKLLQNKTGTDELSLIEKGRAEFETYIINTLKTKAH